MLSAERIFVSLCFMAVVMVPSVSVISQTALMQFF